MVVGSQCHALAALPPGKMTLYKWMGGPLGQSGQMHKNLSPLGFDPQTVQSIASHHTNYAIPAPPSPPYRINILAEYLK